MASQARLGLLILAIGLISSVDSLIAPQFPQCSVNPSQVGVNLFNFLNPGRLNLLQGGHFAWITSTGQILVPGSPEWVAAFGDLTYIQLIGLLNGNFEWNAAYRWLNPNIINLVNGGQGGQFSNLFGWLDLGKLELLQGGRWDSAGGKWITGSGTIIVPGTPDWIKFFGPRVLPGHLDILFPGGGAWNDFFYWITPDFINTHLHGDGGHGNIWGWVPDQNIDFGIWTPEITNWFTGGKFRWLTPDRLSLLRGGYWDAFLNGWVTGKGEIVRPGTDQWVIYFGDLPFPDLLQLLQGEYRWDKVYGWLTPGVLSVLQGGPTPDWALMFGWLTPARLELLRGGRFDFENGFWITGTGEVIKPGTPGWLNLFGPVFGPGDLRLLFPFGGNWNDFYGWINGDWISVNINPVNKWNPPPPPPPTIPPVIIPPVTFPPWKPPHGNVWPPPPPGPPFGPVINFDWGRWRIPQTFIPWFTSGQLSWLTPDRLQLLQGGRWDVPTNTWITGGGLRIVPGSPDWVTYFGDFRPEQMGILFPQGGSWETNFGWLSPQFLQQWSQIQIPRPVWHPDQGVLIPSTLMQFFQGGQMNWLNPDRWGLLQGGRWDPSGNVWITGGGLRIQPSSPDWIKFFGDLQPNTLNLWFPGGGRWEDRFGFMNADFFNRWSGWKPPQPPIWGGGGTIIIPPNFMQFLQSGQWGWLTPERMEQLRGGFWDGGKWTTGQGTIIVPGTPQWIQFFGDLQPDTLRLWFPQGQGSWDSQFGFLYIPGFWQQFQLMKQKFPVIQPPKVNWGEIRIPINAQIPQYLILLFKTGRLNWLTPDRIKMLQGGRWDAGQGVWITGTGQIIRFGTPEWGTFFDGFDVNGMNALFPGGGVWNVLFGWLNEVVAKIPAGAIMGEFKWDKMFQGMGQVQGQGGIIHANTGTITGQGGIIHANTGTIRI